MKISFNSGGEVEKKMKFKNKTVLKICFNWVNNGEGQFKFCYKEEIKAPNKDYCDEKDTENPCVPGKEYYGRGPFQIAGNYNYGPAGRSIGFDCLGAPETVANDPIISFKTALRYWMTNVHLLIISDDQGFGETIRAIDSSECNGGNPTKV
ncbi:chitinase 6-like [Papaver somniferum]|uniref:chitinase 6-like n=1 Tax=Papaver somniferum TaxID=3469 RepID=UPI000E6F7C63|nr:chitinase 6-like [Papaver somniferum]